MDRSTFYQHFNKLGDTPNAVANIREFILRLAVQGRLVPQDPTDEPAAKLLERVSQGKGVHIDSETSRSPELKGWVQTKLGNIINLISGQHLVPAEYNRENKGIPYLTGPADFGVTHPVATRWTEKPKVIASKDDVLLTVKGAGVGKTNVLGYKEAAISRQLMAVRPVGFSTSFLLLILRNLEVVLREKMTGIAIPGISRKDILDRIILLPPLPEQKRIVAKVDELMKLCDELETRQQARRDTRTRLQQSALHHLVEAREPQAFATHWHRVRDNFHLLHETPESVAELRKTILQLAVQGRLVPQDSKDEPAAKLIEQIDTKRTELVALGKLQREPRMKLPSFPERDLPSGWSWCAFGRITFCRDGERIPVASSDRERMDRIYDYYGASGVIDKVDNYIFDKPLLLIGEDGANLVNRSTPIAFIAEGKYWVNNHAHVLDAIDFALLDYLCVYINSINLEPYLTGMAQPKMNQAKMNSIPVPLPPLAEQKRIVAKVDDLMRLCDELENKLSQCNTVGEELVESTVQHLLAS